MAKSGSSGNFGALMRSAVFEYEATTGEKLNGNPLLQAESIDDVMKYTEKKLTDFKDFRHNDGKWDKIRTALGSALQPVATVSTALGAATGNIWPPCAVAFTAINFVVAAASRVRNGFDELLGFLEDIGTYLSALSVLDDGLPQYRLMQLETKVKQIFAAMLIICGISTLYIKQGRLSRGVRLAFSKDDKLGNARDRLEKAVKELDTVVGYSSHRNTNIIRENLTVLNPMREDIQILRKNAEENTPPARRIKDYFGSQIVGDVVLQEKKKTIVPGTAAWVLEDDDYTKWSREAWNDKLSPFLWIHGGPGTGKSYLGYSVIQNISTISERYRKVSLGYYFFSSRSARVSDRTLKIALCNIVAQISDQDDVYSKAVAAKIADIGTSSVEQFEADFIWDQFIVSQYREKSTRKLFLVLVGVDKMDIPDQKSLQDLIQEIYKDKLSIRVLVVSQPSKHVLYHQIEDVDVPEIEVTTCDIEDDMKSYVESQIRKSKTLRKLDEGLQKLIVEKFTEKDGGFGLAALQLEFIEGINQPEDIPKALEQLPEGYKATLEESLSQISRNIQTPEEFKATKVMLYWVAQCYSSFSVSQLRVLIGMKTTYQDFNVRDNVISVCASILEMCDPIDDDESDDDDDDEDDDDEDGDSDDDDDSLDGSSSKGSSGSSNDSSNITSTSGSSTTDGEDVDEETIEFRTDAFGDIFRDDEWSEKYSKTSDLVEHPWASKFDICITLMKILAMSSTDRDYERTRVLEKYCVTYWVDHFLEIDPKNIDEYHPPSGNFPSSSQISHMIEALHTTFTKAECLSAAVEKWDENIYTYFEPQNTSESEKEGGLDDDTENLENGSSEKGLSAVLSWLRLFECLDPKQLKPDAVKWAQLVLEKPSELLKPLAKEHVVHWFTKLDAKEAENVYHLARSALEATGLDRGDDAPVFNAIGIADFFPELEKTDRANRAIGRLVPGLDALEYFEIALGLAKTDLSKFYTYSSFSAAQYSIGDYEAAVASSRAAVELDSGGLFNTIDESEEPIYRHDLYQVYRLIGDCLYPHMSDQESAINAYSQARDVIVRSGYEITDGDDDIYTTSRIIAILAEQEKWSDLVTRVASWSPTECSNWMAIDVEYNKGQTQIFMRAAQVSNQLETLHKCYKDAIDVATEEQALHIRYQLAYVFFHVLEDEDEAYNELQVILCNRDSDNLLREVRKNARQFLLEIIHIRLQVLPTKWVRNLLVDDMQSVFDRGPKKVKDIYTVLPSILLAGAYLDVQNQHAAKQLLGVAFDRCIEALKDTIRGNDSIAFRLLARILGLAGFERDARISMSAKFSVVDLDVQDEKGGSESTAVNNDESIQDGDVKPNPGEHDNLLMKPTTTAIQVIDVNTQIITNTIVQQTSVDGFMAASQLEDLYGAFICICDGECNEAFRMYWRENDPLYMCLVCPGVDLCQTDYDKRMAQNGGEKSTYWKRVCGENHRYLKGPIEGWKGVKNGIMSVGEEKILFKHWLEDVERKWGGWIQEGQEEEKGDEGDKEEGSTGKDE